MVFPSEVMVVTVDPDLVAGFEFTFVVWPAAGSDPVEGNIVNVRVLPFGSVVVVVMRELAVGRKFCDGSEFVD